MDAGSEKYARKRTSRWIDGGAKCLGYHAENITEGYEPAHLQKHKRVGVTKAPRVSAACGPKPKKYSKAGSGDRSQSPLQRKRPHQWAETGKHLNKSATVHLEFWKILIYKGERDSR